MFQCAISINGVTHLPEQLDYDLDYIESEKLLTKIKQALGDPKADKVMLKAKSPALHADKITIPILLIHGVDDKRVPYEQSELMLEALEDINGEVELITLEDTGHAAFREQDNIEKIYKATEKFLRTHMGPIKKLN